MFKLLCKQCTLDLLQANNTALIVKAVPHRPKSLLKLHQSTKNALRHSHAYSSLSLQLQTRKIRTSLIPHSPPKVHGGLEALAQNTHPSTLPKSTPRQPP